MNESKNTKIRKINLKRNHFAGLARGILKSGYKAAKLKKVVVIENFLENIKLFDLIGSF